MYSLKIVFQIWLKINDRQDIFKTVIFVNSYYEYIRLRNYFKYIIMILIVWIVLHFFFFRKTNSFVQFICEYTSKSTVQSRLSQFNKKNIPFLLFSERAYFFKMYYFYIFLFEISLKMWVEKCLQHYLLFFAKKWIYLQKYDNIIKRSSRW